MAGLVVKPFAAAAIALQFEEWLCLLQRWLLGGRGVGVGVLEYFEETDLVIIVDILICDGILGVIVSLALQFTNLAG